MKKAILVSGCCFALTSILPFVRLTPANAQEQTLALCETPFNTIRVYRMNNQPMMRVFDRRANTTWLNAPANRAPGAEGVNYSSTQAGQNYQLFVASGSNRSCSFRVGNFPPESGTASVSETITSTLALCQGNLNTMRIYTMNGQLMIRAFDRLNNRTWLDTAARRNPNPQGVEYLNLRGEQSVRVFVANDRNLPCAINIGNQTVDLGRVLERSL